ncbi:MAG: phosphotransferase family protein [Actinobacteria bacterium]|nr:phosphotransferase family protein [Actinomycetota bacterium]
MKAEAIAARVWPGRVLQIERLGGGITNHNFLVDCESERFVLRIAGTNTELLGIDRNAEHAAAVSVADLGVGPEVVDFVEGSLVTRFVEGQPVPVEEMRRPEVLRETADLLRRVHDGPAFPARFDAFRVVEAYHDTAAAHGVRVPDAYRKAKAKADRIEQELGHRAEHPCHNDLLNANFIRSPDGIRIVDWEYAGIGDRFFDLANFSVNHELPEEQSDVLLGAYFGELRDQDREHLRAMRFMSDFREAMWGVVQQGISDLDFDFENYANRHFERALA